MSRPMYQVISERLREQIETGALQPGAQLPTEADLQETYHASRNTVRDAVKRLIQLGLLETRPGVGTFVRRQLIPVVNTLGPYPAGEVTGHTAEAARHRPTSFSSPRVEIREADSQLASTLRLPAGARIIIRHQLCSVDGMPWSLQTTFYPMELVERGAARLLSTGEIDTGTLSYLYDTLNIRMETWRARLSCRPANETEAQFFQLRPGAAVVEINQICYEQSMTPFCFTAMVYPTDRNLFQIAVGSTPPLDQLWP